MTTTPSSAAALALHDGRAFFEKALAYGVQHGLIGTTKLAAICTEAPKGMVQIARYFGNENLRPELEKARLRIVNLVSLYLEDTSGGDLQLAAQSLRDHSLLSRSKGGSDMLKRLIAMPQNSHFAMHERGGFTDAQIPQLAQWSLRSYADYRAELAKRAPVLQTIEAALWFAQRFGLGADDLEEAGTDAEAVIRTGLLLRALAPKLHDWPDALVFEKLITALRQRKSAVVLTLPPNLPPEHQTVVEALRQSLQAELPRLCDASQTVRAVLHAPDWLGHYFWLEDPLAEVDHYHRHFLHEDAQAAQPGSKTWQRLTQDQEDEHALLTLFVSLAAGSPRKTVWTEKTAASVVRRIRKHGFHPELATTFIRENAPSLHQAAYCQLWESFVEDARKTLCSDLDYGLHDALALLRRECHIVA